MLVAVWPASIGIRAICSHFPVGMLAMIGKA